ncbi:hypothetical protein OEA41_007096 [Lepraria neglecta]|uniref:DUF7492 domain-containing protein n=1 Tax=Lepraria neglecta TaxID=209136 RepID=A0AAD9Z964_9LECA|nr:hypothetical protein OEA41_007096 [Lepraria neglecta]
MRHSAAGALVALALIITPSTAHSWVEQMMVISSNGSFTGNPGYARNNTMRAVPGFSDLFMVHILPGQGQPSIEERQAPAASAATPPTSTATAFSDTMSILPTDPMCKKTQQTMTQSNGSPRLQAAPGENIALRYQENGHVTLPQNQPGKPANRGMVYIYGTTQPKTDENFLDVFKQWTTDGTGGDKRGVLLATQPFDDGQCYQVNSGNISTERQNQYPHTANQLMGASLWCQNDIALPADAPSGKPYTLYWVWDWPTAPGVDPNLPNGKAEIYTTCMDIDITGTKASRDLEERQAPAASAASGANINIMAVPKYMKELATPNPQSAQAVQATPALSPAASSPAAAAPAAPATTAPASPESAAGAVLEASDTQAASEFISYLETAVTAADPSVAKLLASDMATVTVTAPAQTVTVTETPCASSAAMAGQQSIVTISSTISSTMQTVYAASTPVQPAAQAPSQAPAASPSTHVQAPTQAPAQSPAASPSTTAQAAAQAPAQSPAAKSSLAVLPPPVLNLQPPVTSGAPPPTSAAAPAASAASSPASSPASSAAAAGAPPFAASPAASAQIPGSPTAPTTETPPAGVPSAPAAAATPLPPSAAAPAAASPASSSNPAGIFPSGVAAPSGGMQFSFTGTASAVSAAPTGSASPAAAPKGCSVKTACKLKKRSLLLSGHARFH